MKEQVIFLMAARFKEKFACSGCACVGTLTRKAGRTLI
jgi:uncharacterized metal-binding protein